MTRSRKTPVRWKAVCVYDGGSFHGWQSQINAVGVQDVIEAALEAVLETKTRIHGSGRTDTGVHALEQVFHFDAIWRHAGAQFLAALGTQLPQGVQIKTLRRAAADFHARFSATGKRYHYRLYLGRADPFEEAYCWSILRPLNVEAMKQTALLLEGRHDFAAFSAFNGDEKETTVRKLRRLELKPRGRRLRIVLEADGFLYKMARSIVGAIVAAGLEKATPEGIAALLKSKCRIAAIQTAPAQGLFLERVFYK